MCIRDRLNPALNKLVKIEVLERETSASSPDYILGVLDQYAQAVSYTHLRAHETVLDIVCRLLLEKKKEHQFVFPAD